MYLEYFVFFVFDHYVFGVSCPPFLLSVYNFSPLILFMHPKRMEFSRLFLNIYRNLSVALLVKNSVLKFDYFCWFIYIEKASCLCTLIKDQKCTVTVYYLKVRFSCMKMLEEKERNHEEACHL